MEYCTQKGSHPEVEAEGYAEYSASGAYDFPPGDLDDLIFSNNDEKLHSER